MIPSVICFKNADMFLSLNVIVIFTDARIVDPTFPGTLRTGINPHMQPLAPIRMPEGSGPVLSSGRLSSIPFLILLPIAGRFGGWQVRR